VSTLLAKANLSRRKGCSRISFLIQLMQLMHSCMNTNDFARKTADKYLIKGMTTIFWHHRMNLY